MQCDVAEIIALLDGPNAAARLLGVKPPSVIEWRRRNAIPTERCAAVEKALSGKYRRWHMRPADWHLIWPELVADPEAPPLPVSSAPAAQDKAPTTELQHREAA